MPRSEKHLLATEFEERWIAFQMGLSDKRKYPAQQGRVVWENGRRYAEMPKNDAVVVASLHGLTRANCKRLCGMKSDIAT